MGQPAARRPAPRSGSITPTWSHTRSSSPSRAAQSPSALADWAGTAGRPSGSRSLGPGSWPASSTRSRTPPCYVSSPATPTSPTPPWPTSARYRSSCSPRRRSSTPEPAFSSSEDPERRVCPAPGEGGWRGGHGCPAYGSNDAGVVDVELDPRGLTTDHLDLLCLGRPARPAIADLCGDAIGAGRELDPEAPVLGVQLGDQLTIGQAADVDHEVVGGVEPWGWGRIAARSVAGGVVHDAPDRPGACALGGLDGERQGEQDRGDEELPHARQVIHLPNLGNPHPPLGCGLPMFAASGRSIGVDQDAHALDVWVDGWRPPSGRRSLSTLSSSGVSDGTRGKRPV